MKKSKIIIPAAAILALSVGASVTGTVAWFTASRKTSMTANNLAVMNAAGNLGFKVTSVFANDMSYTDSSVTMTYLKDASYDVGGNKSYRAKLNADGSLITGTAANTALTAKTSVTIGDSTYPVYYVNQWTGRFTTTSDEDNVLLLNVENAASYIGETYSDVPEAVYNSFRISMKTLEYTVIFAPYTKEADVYYVKAEGDLGTPQSATTAPIEADYGDSLVGKYTNAVKRGATSAFGEGSSLSTMESYHVVLSKTLSSSKPIDVTFTAWFEGLDQDCIIGKSGLSDLNNQTKKNLTLGFYAVDSTTLAD